MSEVILFSKNNQRAENIVSVLQRYNPVVLSEETELFEFLKNNSSSVIIIDTSEIAEPLPVCRSVKFMSQINNSKIILILDTDKNNKDFLKYGSAYISEPINNDILTETVNSVLLSKNSFDELAKTNAGLSTSLYRLKVLNETVTALAASLDKTELIEIMTEGIERSLSFQLCYSLVFNDPSDITLVINSVNAISSRLEEAIKLRAMYSYKELFNIHTTKEEIKVIKKIKRKDFEYDLNVFGFDTVFAPINIKNKFFGIIEVFKEKDFNNEDTSSFQTLVKQATFPLQSAVLYEEIKEQNIKLEDMEKKKSEFFSIVSHELKTPLTAIKGAVSILLGDSFQSILPDKSKVFIKMIYKHSDRLFSIIQDWLDSKQAEAGKLEFKFKVANINPVVESVKQSLTNLSAEKNIDIMLTQKENLPAVFVDVKRIEQIIVNLVSNAIKYTQAGGKITISASIMDAVEIKEKPFDKNKDRVIADEYVVIKVSDNGPGIAEGDVSKVFEKFEQVQGTLSRSVGGTGLGLFIAKQFAETHNGFLWVESVVDKGSDFYLAIPVLSEIERFEMMLHYDISNAEKDKKKFGLITLCENKVGEEPYLVEFINKLNSENVFKKSVESRYFYTETKERLYYSFYDVNMNMQIFNFVVQRIIDYAKSDYTVNNGKKIYISTTVYPEAAGDAEELIKKSKKLLKEVTNG